jgi:hypothetical protein
MSFSFVRPMTSEARSSANSIPARSVVSTNIRAGAVPAVRSGTDSPRARIGIVGCASETSGTGATTGAWAAGLAAAAGADGCAGLAETGDAR